MSEMRAARTTSWRLLGVNGHGLEVNEAGHPLALTLSVDTDTPEIIETIEQAAARNGVELERQ